MKKLLFVYNAKSGTISLVKDMFHKVISPSTYPCNLCKITYDMLDMKKPWKSFIDKLGIEVEFLHKDEFLKQYDKKDAVFPCAFLKDGKNLRYFINAKKMGSFKSADDLMDYITQNLPEGL